MSKNQTNHRFKLLKSMLREAEIKYRKAQIKMDMYLNNHPGTPRGYYRDSESIYEQKYNEKED